MVNKDKVTAEDRRKRALRENLKRRKAQARGLKAGSGMMSVRQAALQSKIKKPGDSGDQSE
jgi:hypothetical protein